MQTAYVRPGDHRPHDALGRREPRRIMADPVVMARALPGLAAVFSSTVPDTHRICRLEWREQDATEGVRCPCGAETPLPDGLITACAGGCHRWFWRVGDTIRVATP